MSRQADRRFTARAVHALRQMKLALFVLRKRAGWKWHMVWVRPADPVWRLYQRLRPFVYEPDRYESTFLARTSTATLDPGPIPRRIFVVWAGDNEMSANRRRGLQSIRDHNPDVEVVLITEHTMADWIVPKSPLHPAYEYLSWNHRSDHLRAYLLHHHGGGYCDVKPVRGPWFPAFDRLEASDRWLVGYTEVRFDMVAKIDGQLGRDLVRASTLVLGCGAFIARTGSALTAELLDEQHRRLTEAMDDLSAHPGGKRGETEGYPIPWLGLMGSIMGPLCLKYQDRILHDDSIKVVFEDYL